jgi:hypothetical protein
MAYPVIMPKTGMAMEEGTILRWLKREGEMLLEIETDKTSMEAEADGLLLRVLHQAGEVVPVTQTIAWIGQPGEPLSEAAGPAAAPAAPASAALTPSAALAPASPAAAPAPAARSAVPGKVAATPAAKRRAIELGVPLASVSGTGPFGAVRLRDLAGAEERATKGAAAVAEGQPLAGLRIGLSWGTTLFQVVHHLRPLELRGVEVVQLHGGLGAEDPAIDAFGLAQGLAEKLHGRYRVIQAPISVASRELREQLVREPGIAETLKRGARADLALFEIGTNRPRSCASPGASGWLRGPRRRRRCGRPCLAD